MAQNIKLKRSSVAGKVPTTSQLEAGEIAINTADGKLYFERDDSTIQTIVTTNATITGSLNINGPITGSDIQIAEWGSISASLVSIQSGANNLTLDNVTDNGSTTTNNITVGRITSQTTGLATTGLFTTTDGENTFILQSSGSGGTNPGKVTLKFKEHTQTLPGEATISYGGNGSDIFTFENNSGAKFKFQGSPTDQEFWLYNGGGSGSMLWGDDGTEFIVRIGTGTTQFYGNARTATTASYALTASYASNVPLTASYALQAASSSYATSATSASFATTASFATSAALVEFANIANKPTLVSGSAQINLSQATGTAASAVSASYASSVDFANIAGKPTLVSGSAQINLSQATGTAATAVTASYALTASYVSPGAIAGTVLSASYAATASSADAFRVRSTLIASGLTYPTTDGTFEGQLLQTNAAGTLSFVDPTTTYETVYNGEATTLVKGTPVYISGSNGANPKVYAADAANPAKMPVTYIVSENITTASTGRGIILGLISGIDLTGYLPGQAVYVAPGGGWTAVRPTGSATIQFLGLVAKEGSGGKGLVLNPGPATLPNLTSGSAWVGDSNSYPVAVPTASFLVTQAVSASLAALATTASYALKAESVGQLNQNVVINGNLQVFGTSSFTYVTSSQLDVDNAFISVNVFEPVERFGGLKVYDSGSSTATASLAWDSLHNHWVYQNVSGSTYTGGMLLSGPRNTGSLGDEPTLTKWFVPRSDGGDHLDNSQIYSSGSVTQITGSLTTSGKVYIETVDNYGSDPDKFLSIVNNEVVYRTGAQLLSDIGGQTAGTFVQNSGLGGTARYIMRYEDSNSATTSSIYEDTSGRIGINRTTPGHALDISGSNIQIGSILIGRGLTPDTVLLIGSGSLTTYTGSSSQTVVGNNALTSLTTGTANDAFGAYTLNQTTTGTYNTAFGQSAGRRNNGSQNVFFGQFSGPYYHSLSGSYNVFIGPLAGIYTSGSAAKNTAIGASSLYNLSVGSENTGIGSAALFDVTTGSGNIAFGFNTARGITTGNYNIVIGNGVTGLSSGLSNNIIIADGQGNIKYQYADNNTTVSGSLTVQGDISGSGRAYIGTVDNAASDTGKILVLNGQEVEYRSSSQVLSDIGALPLQSSVIGSYAMLGTSTLTLTNIPASTYEAAFINYLVTSGSNKRAGTVTAVWHSSSAALEWNDASTMDIGSTTGAEFSFAITGADLIPTLSLPAGVWALKYHLSYM